MAKAKKHTIQIITPKGMLGGSYDEDAIDRALRIIATAFYSGDD